MECSFQPVFEVAESALGRFPEYWRPICELYRRNGFRLALTYGVGDPISMRTLLDIWPDYIKLEKTLVGNIETLPSSLAIRRLAELGARFHIPVVADGVDRRITAENLWLLNVASPVPDEPEFRLDYWPSHSTPPSRTSKAWAPRGRRCWRRGASELLKTC